MKSSASVVVIGGGVIGLSVAYHLAKRGVSDVMLFEKNTLTSGTSWHAAGIVGPLRASQNLTALAKYAIDLFQQLPEETGQATGYQQTGGWWLASEPERLAELHRIAAMGLINGLEATIVGVEEISNSLPWIDVKGLVGGLWVPQDGQVNPVDLCMAYAKGARDQGVKIYEGMAVDRVVEEQRCVYGVVLENGAVISCDRVINCAGLWARGLALKNDVGIPLQAVEHRYIVTEPMSALPNPCPIVRDLDRGIYLKGDAGRLVLGAFEANAKIWEPNDHNPKDSFLMFESDWDHAAPMFEAGVHRVPALAELGVQSFINGPESFTPDTRQIMGESAELDGYFVAAGFNSIGIMSSAGVGKAMAKWVMDEEPPMDLWEVDVQRFSPDDNDTGFLKSRIPESVHNQFAMHWPLNPYATGRDRKRSVWHDQLAARGAVFDAPTGWERPFWFAQEPGEDRITPSYGAQCWWPAAEREAKRLMEYGGLFELSPFTKIDLVGRNICRVLQPLFTNKLDQPVGKMVYTLMLNDYGGIEADATVTRLGEDHWRMVTGAATRYRDLARLRKLLPSNMLIHDATDDEVVIGVMGPNSRAVLEQVIDVPQDLARFPFAYTKEMRIANIDVKVARMSFVGEFGYEVYIPATHGAALLPRIETAARQQGMDFAGHFCLDSCRLEKGFVHWGHDIGRDDDPVSAGLMHAVCLDGRLDFIGLSAIETILASPLKSRLVLFEVESDRILLTHDEAILWNGELVGCTTSGGLGFRTQTVLCMAHVDGRLDLEDQSAQWQVVVAGELFGIRPLPQPPYDPYGRRMKA